MKNVYIYEKHFPIIRNSQKSLLDMAIFSNMWTINLTK